MHGKLSYVLLIAFVLLPAGCRAQKAPDATRGVANAGIAVPGWLGAADGAAATRMALASRPSARSA